MTDFRHGKRVQLIESDLLHIYSTPFIKGDKYRLSTAFDDLELKDIAEIYAGIGKFLESKDALPVAYSALDSSVLEEALRSFIADLDYDVHKGIETDEETGEDRYQEQVESFVAAYEKAVEKALEEGE